MILFFNTILSQNDTKMIKSIHEFSVTDIYGKNFDFNKIKGKKIMVVNTASKCGLTYQYENLEKLYNQYKNENFVIESTITFSLWDEMLINNFYEKLNKVLEEMIIRNPYQWIWTHNRWK